MLRLCDSIDSSILNENWYSALLGALTLPDICGAIEYPKLKELKENGIVINRYTKWFDEFVGEDYKIRHNLNKNSLTYLSRAATLTEHGHHLEQVSDTSFIETFLNGYECYILRCNYLHEGYGNTISADQRKNILNGFNFIRPIGPNIVVHNNLKGEVGNTIVQLQVDVFAKGMADHARDWWNSRADKESLADNFLRIE